MLNVQIYFLQKSPIALAGGSILQQLRHFSSQKSKGRKYNILCNDNIGLFLETIKMYLLHYLYYFNGNYVNFPL